jgi:hypothetical protein
MDIKALYSKFVEQENLPKDWKKQLYEALSSFVPSDLKTIDEHRMYVETLQQLRESNAEDMQLNNCIYSYTFGRNSRNSDNKS